MIATRRNTRHTMDRGVRHLLPSIGSLATALLLAAAILSADGPAMAQVRVRHAQIRNGRQFINGNETDPQNGEELIENVFLPADRSISQQHEQGAQVAGSRPLQRRHRVPGQDPGIARRLLLPAGQAGARASQLEGRGATAAGADAGGRPRTVRVAQRRPGAADVGRGAGGRRRREAGGGFRALFPHAGRL